MNVLNLNLSQEITACQNLLAGIKSDIEMVELHHQYRTLRRKLERIASYLKVEDDAQEHRHQSTFTRPKYYVHFWGRDCDCFEAHDVREFDSRKEALDAMDDWHSDAEGPTSAEFISQDDYHFFLMDPPEPRDRILEAFEDGRAMCATI